MISPPHETSKCIYNITCLRCGYREIRSFDKLREQTCKKCSQAVGLTYRCRNCNKSFAYDKEDKPKSNKALLSDFKPKRCPACRSEDVYYVTVKQIKAKRKKSKSKKK
jgi:Zn ribbon nucleic-acid-binding protein